MTETEWMTDIKPVAGWGKLAEMFKLLEKSNISSRSRKYRLFAAAVLRESWRGLCSDSRFAVKYLEEMIYGTSLPVLSVMDNYNSFDTMAVCIADSYEAAIHAHQAAGNLFTNPALQESILRDVIGNPFRPPQFKWVGQKLFRVVKRAEGVKETKGIPLSFLAELVEPVGWPSRQSIDLAEAVASSVRDNGRIDAEILLPLADSLEESGCDYTELLMHLRGKKICRYCMLPDESSADYGGGRFWCPGCGGSEEDSQGWMMSGDHHVRGCWVVDFILGGR